MKRLILVSWLLGVMLLGSATPALAQGPAGDRVAFGSDVDLAEGEVVGGSIVVFGGNLNMDPGSRVDGDVVVFGGNGDIDGEVYGDVVFIGGNLRVGESALIDGDITATFGSRLSVAEGADIRGSTVDIGGQELRFRRDFELHVPPPVPPEAPGGVFRPTGLFGRIVSTIGDGIQNMVAALVVAALGLLITLVLPQHTQVVANAVSQAPVVTFGVGFISLLAALALLILLALLSWLLVPICGLVALVIGLTAALLFGWIVVGRLLGERLLRTAQPGASQATAALVGIALLTAVWLMPVVDHLPLIGWLFSFLGVVVAFLAGSTGLGAVVLTRFGTQAYVPAAAPAARPSPPVPPGIDAGTTGEAGS